MSRNAALRGSAFTSARTEVKSSIVSTFVGSRPEPAFMVKVLDSVIRVKREMGEVRSDHPATFPVALPSALVPVWTDEGDIVAEPFGGSGATLLACAATGRVARLIELDPRYCDVIRRRWTRYAREAGIDPGPGALEG